MRAIPAPPPAGRRFFWAGSRDVKGLLEVAWVDDDVACAGNHGWDHDRTPLYHRVKFQPLNDAGLPLTALSFDPQGVASAKEVGLYDVAYRCPRSLTGDERARLEIAPKGHGAFEKSLVLEKARRASGRSRGGSEWKEPRESGEEPEQSDDPPKRTSEFEKLFP
jgi:hypothetical protein